MRGEVLPATSPVTTRVPCILYVAARWDPEVHKANPLARRSVGKVGYVGQVKRAPGNRLPPEDHEVDELA